MMDGFTPNRRSVLRSAWAGEYQHHTHQYHPVGSALKTEIAAYTDELKLVKVIRPATDTARFADKVYADVLSS